MMYRSLSLAIATWAVAGCSVEHGGLPSPPVPARTDARAPAPGEPDKPPDEPSEPAVPGVPGVPTVPNVPDVPNLDAAARPDAAPPVADAAPAPPDAAPLPAVDAEIAPVDAPASVDAAAQPDAQPAPLPPPACPDDPALSLCLRFEGRVLDESPHAQPVAAAGVRYQQGPSGMAAALGPDSDLRLADSALFDAPTITVEAWLSPRALPPAGQRRGIADSPGQYGMFLLPPATVMCIAGQAQAEARDVLAVDRWTSAACTFDGDVVSVWIEGKKVAQVPSGGVSQGGHGGLTVGLNNPSGEHFEGLLDNVRLWRRVRSAADLCASAHACR
jgi:hypothetical protein